MEIEKLKNRLLEWDGVDTVDNGEFTEVNYHGVFDLLREAADALKQLQAENDRMKEEAQKMRWIPVEERPPEEIGNYAYPPAHIDREAWKPCEHCKPKCRICANCSILGKCGEPQVCVDCKDYSNFYSDYNYCDYCGRPMTKEAWEELEKRVRGEK